MSECQLLLNEGPEAEEKKGEGGGERGGRGAGGRGAMQGAGSILTSHL